MVTTPVLVVWFDSKVSARLLSANSQRASSADWAEISTVHAVVPAVLAVAVTVVLPALAASSPSAIVSSVAENARVTVAPSRIVTVDTAGSASTTRPSASERAWNWTSKVSPSSVSVSTVVSIGGAARCRIRPPSGVARKPSRRMLSIGTPM